MTQKLTDLPIQELTSRVAKVIEVAQRRGFNGPWSLARFVLLAIADASREDVLHEAEALKKSTPKIRQHSQISRKCWRRRKRVDAARAAAEAKRGAA